MSGNKELIDSWNKFFQFKLKDSDLLKPTEEMLIEALESYIKKINIDIYQIKNVLVEYFIYLLSIK